MRHFFIFCFIIFFSIATANAQCPTFANTTFTPTDVSCYGFNDGALHVVFNDGAAPYTFVFAYDLLTTNFYVPGIDFTLTQNAPNDFTLTGMKPGIYLIRINCSGGGAVNLVDPNINGTTHIHEAIFVNVPDATDATGIGCNDFTSNWDSVGTATGYRLDVASDINFSSILAGYNDLDVGNNLSQLVNGLTEGTSYYYRVRAYAGSCPPTTSSDTITVTTSPLPVMQNLNGPSPDQACEGDNYFVSMAGSEPGVTYEIYVDGNPSGITTSGTGAALNVGPINTLAAGSTYTLTVNATTGAGCSQLMNGSVSLTVNAVPATPSPSNDGPKCEGENIQLSTAAVGGATYLWTGPGAFSSNLQNPILNNVTAADAGMYQVTVTVSGCTSLPGSTTVVVNAIPATPVPSNDGPACEGDNVQLSTAAVAGATYQWNGPNGFSSNLQNPILSNVVVADAGVYAVTVTVSGCTSPAGNTTVVVNTIPLAPIASNDGPKCEGENIQLSTPAVVGATYQWSGPNGYSSNLQNPILNNVAVADAGVYSVTVTVSGCTSPAGNTTVLINPLPDASITPAGPFCDSDAALNLTAATAGGTWSGPGITDAVAGTFDPAVAGAGSHVIQYQVTVGGCTSTSTTTIDVNPTPDSSITPAGPFCDSDAALNLTAATPGGTWSGPGITDAVAGTFDPAVAGAGSHVIQYQVTVGGCTSTSTTTIDVNPTPDSSITPAGPFCDSDAALNLTAATPGGTWSGPGITDAVAGTFDPAVAGAGSHVIQYQVTVGGCTSTSTTTIDVNPTPDSSITPAGPFCDSDAALNLTAATPGGTWSGPGITDAVAGTFDPAVAGAGSHVIQYQVTVGGCTSTSTTTIDVNPTPDSSITPAGPFCDSDAALNLTAATPGGSWSGPGITDAVAGTFDPAVAGAGSHVIQYQVTVGGCTSTSTTTIDVNPTPDSSITPAGPFCDSDAALNLTAATPGGTWSGPGITDAVAGTFDPAVAGAGSHVIQYQVTVGGCTSTSTTTIDVNPTPDSSITPAGPFCDSDAALNLTAATPGGSWSGPGITDAVAGTFDPAVAGAGSHVIQYQVTVGGCTSTSTTTIDVNPTPDSSITPAGPFCDSDAALNLTAATPGGTWSGPGITDAVAGTFDPAVAGAGSHVIQYQVTVGGCTSTSTTTIDVNPTPDSSITPAGPFCDSDAALNLTAATPGGTWSGPGITDAVAGTFDPAVAGAGSHVIQYQVTVGGCTSTSTTTIDVNPTPDSSITPAGPFCDSDAALNLTAATPGGSWSGPGITDAVAGTFDPAVAGAGSHVIQYQVTVGGCTSTSTTTIDVNPTPDSSITPAGPFCDSDAALNLTAATPGGTWSGPGITDAVAGTFDPAVAGLGSHPIQYQVTVGSCTSLSLATIQVSSTPDPSINPAGPFCDNGAAVNLTAVTPGGTWSGTGITDASAGTFDPSVAGLGSHTIRYDITIGTCSAFSTINIQVDPGVDATITPVGPFCDNDASVNLNAATAGGTWSGPGITDAVAGTFDPAIAGPGNHVIQYDITSGTCTSTDTETITVNPSPVVSITPAGPYCIDALPVNLSGNPGGGTWSGPGITDAVAGTFNPAAAGAGTHAVQYSVTSGGCTGVAVANIDVIALPMATISSSDADNTICFGDPVLFTAGPNGQPQYDFYLNGALVQGGGNIGYSNNGLVDLDSVNVRVTDAFGCSADASGIVTRVTQMVIDWDSTNISTCGATDGEIVINNITGGIGPYSLSWTGPGGFTSTASTISNLERGTYDLTVTDQGSGCTEGLSVYMPEPANFTLSFNKVDVSTFGGNDGSIDLTITGGSGNFTIGWTDGGGAAIGNTEDISGLIAGNYTGTVTDNVSGCTDAVFVQINQPGGGGLMLSDTHTDVTTCGASDGTINLIISGGSLDYFISWVGPNGFTSNFQNLSGLEGGLYIVTVLDNVTSATAQWTVQIDEPPTFSLSTVVTDITYCDSMDGAVDLTVTGGSANFSFLWSGLGAVVFSSTDQSISNLERGGYRAVVTDNSTGCLDSIDALVGRPAICDQPCALDVEATTNNITCPGYSDGVSVINVISGGSGDGNYYVSLDSGSTFVPFLGMDITSIINQGQGSYLFIVKDTITGCRDTTIANVGVKTDLMAVINVDDAGCATDDGKITFNVGGGVQPFEVDLIHADGFVDPRSGTGFFQFTGLSEGRYFYAIREQSGCAITPSDSIELNLNCSGGCTDLLASAGNFEDATCATTPNGKAVITVTGGSSPYEYSVDGTTWITFVSGNVIDQLPGNGTYNVVVRQDSANATCRVEVSVTINGPAPIKLDNPIITVQEANCNVSDGAVKVGAVSGGTQPYDYQVDGNFIVLPSDSIVSGLMAGLHTFSVVDDLGCQADFPFSVTSPGAVIADAEEVPVSCAEIELKAGIRVIVDLVTTDVSGPYEIVINPENDPTDVVIYPVPDSGIRTIYGFSKGYYEVTVRAVSGSGCSYNEVVSLQNGVFPVDFDIISYDSIVGCSGDMGSVTIGNVTGDTDTLFYVHLVQSDGLILDTYPLYYTEIENGFTIDEDNSENLFSGSYFVRIIQNQTGCPGIEATSGVFNVYEPSANLDFQVNEDAISYPDQPTGSIDGEVIPSGGDPYDGLIQLLEPGVPLSLAEIAAFNDARDWINITASGPSNSFFPVLFEELWPGRYEISIMDAYGCLITREYVVGRDTTIFIPNVFTPNEDGFNDVFFIRNLPLSGTQLLVTNRLGKTVYKTDDYNIDNLWDGGDAADGIYYYKLILPGGQGYAGWVELWRGASP